MNESFLAANEGSSVRAWLAAFDTFEAMRPETIVPSHGAIGGGDLIPVQRSIVAQIRKRALELKAQGRSRDETGTMLQAELTEAHPGWPRGNGIAPLARSAWSEGR